MPRRPLTPAQKRLRQLAREAGRTPTRYFVIIVDDGLATGSTAEAAVRVVILTGGGGHFSAGGDVKTMAAKRQARSNVRWLRARPVRRVSRR